MKEINKRKLAKAVSWIVSLAIILGCFPITVQAVGETGTTGIWKWKVLGDGTLSITGCTAPSGNLSLPATLNTGAGPVDVTRIESNAFKSDPIFFPSAIETFVMPDSVTSVGDGVFSWCINLTSVTLSQNLKNIGASMFYNCRKLTDVVIPDSVESIGSEAFTYCYDLSSVTLPNNTNFTAIPSKLFSSAGKLKTTNIASLTQLTSIGSQAFFDSGIESISLPDSITAIGERAFEACRLLKSISLPKNAGFTALPNDLFSECNTLQSLDIPANVTSLGDGILFNGCYELINITVGAGSTAFTSEDGVLYNLDQTVLIRHPAGRTGTLDIPGSVKQIGDYAFLDSKQLAGVSIPSGMAQIGKYAFFNCNHACLTKVVLPQTVKSIGEYAFGYCSALKVVIVHSPDAVFDDKAFTGAGLSSDGIYGLDGSTAQAYATAKGIPFHILPPDTAPTISTASLEDGTVGAPYSATLAADGTAPITWSIDSGSLPDGLSLSDGGVIFGTPTSMGTYCFSVQAANSAGVDTKALSILVAEAPRDSFVIATSAGVGGTVTPSGNVMVNRGENLAFVMEPYSGYTISDVLVDGVSVGALSSYTFSNVTAHHTLTAVFAAVGNYGGGGSGGGGSGPRTLTDDNSGISTSGLGISNNAVLTVGNLDLDNSEGGEAFQQYMDAHDATLLFARDITIAQGFNGTLTITIPVDERYNGQTVTILHYKNGNLETYTATVADGKVVFDVTSLSPFAVIVSSAPDPELDIPQTGDSANMPFTFFGAAIVAAFGITFLLRKGLRRE